MGSRMKRSLKGVDPEDARGQIGLNGFGTLYAWGYGQNGRLGLVSAILLLSVG